MTVIILVIATLALLGVFLLAAWCYDHHLNLKYLTMRVKDLERINERDHA